MSINWTSKEEYFYNELPNNNYIDYILGPIKNGYNEIKNRRKSIEARNEPLSLIKEASQAGLIPKNHCKGLKEFQTLKDIISCEES